MIHSSELKDLENFGHENYALGNGIMVRSYSVKYCCATNQGHAESHTPSPMNSYVFKFERDLGDWVYRVMKAVVQPDFSHAFEMISLSKNSIEVDVYLWALNLLRFIQ